ncbi:MAG: site-2 protease family protein [Chloroflexota bacterium]|jgi:membrane-associated protease RseP (regulator of RpoE activity)
MTTDWPMREESLAQPAEIDPLQRIIAVLRGDLAGLFEVVDVAPRPKVPAIAFAGRFQVAADDSYEELHRRFQRHGYTPFIRREDGRDVILAVEGLVDRSKDSNPLINILLLVATILTTLAAGAAMSGYSVIDSLLLGSPLAVMQALVAGAPFAITLMGILGVHELGHYAAARLHGVRASLPYFIPMPFGLGTLGAFISIRSPMRDRKVLFDIGLAGPYAGLLAALPLLLMGLLLSSTNFVPVSFPGLTLETLGSSVLIRIVVDFLSDIPEGQTLVLHPVFFAAWIGLFLTGINLLPAGQLDGGHASYALLGRFAHGLAIFVFGLLILAGIFDASNRTFWFIWAFFVMLGGLRHPPPMNDISSVGWPRKIIGLLTFLLFLLLFTPPMPLR